MKFKGNFIGGKFVQPSGRTKRFVSEDPGDLDHPVGEAAWSVSAVKEAVAAARAAFPKWALKNRLEREHYLARFQKNVKAAVPELALLITREMGKILTESRAEAERILGKVDTVRKYESALVGGSHHLLEDGSRGRLRFKPRGVLAVLSPFNVPAYLAAGPVISALATGNTVVLKPSELTPFTSQFLAVLFQKTGLPPGVFNLVQGTGDVGQALIGHSGIDGVIFTGSWHTGSKIEERTRKDPHKICALEMGGKNAAIILKDADFVRAAREAASGAFMTTGQRCNSTSRIIVEKRAAKEFIRLFLEQTNRIKIGYGGDPAATMGPAASRRGFEKVLELTGRAAGEGFETLRHGGPAAQTKKGYYLRPSVHLMEGGPAFGLRPGSYADEEIFGPDAAVYIVRDLEQALALANRSQYGLVTSVFTRSREKFEAVFQTAQTGLINWNVSTARSSARLPFGGLKQSGNHRPAGFFYPYLCTVPTASVEKAG